MTLTTFSPLLLLITGTLDLGPVLYRGLSLSSFWSMSSCHRTTRTLGLSRCRRGTSPCGWMRVARGRARDRTVS